MRTRVPKTLRRSRERFGPLATDDSFGMTGRFRVKPPASLGPEPVPQALLIQSADPATFDDADWADHSAGWEHVSVSLLGGHRLPTWDEMGYVKRLFWGPDEAVLQFHPPESAYVNNGEVLHLWRKPTAEAELPPPILVGFPSACTLGGTPAAELVEASL